MLIIDGVTYDVPIVSIRRNADFLDKSAFRTQSGVLNRELIGVYFNYRLELGRTFDTAEYAALWNKLSEPVPFHTVTVPDVEGSFTFTAYFSNVSDEVLISKGDVNRWKNLTVNFIARSPARK